MNWRDASFFAVTVNAVLLSAASAFGSVLAWSMRVCDARIDPYALSPVGVTHLLFDVLFAAICGPVVAAVCVAVWRLAVPATSRARPFGGTGVVAIMIVGAYLSVTILIFVLVKPAPGMCRFDT